MDHHVTPAGRETCGRFGNWDEQGGTHSGVPSSPGGDWDALSQDTTWTKEDQRGGLLSLVPHGPLDLAWTPDPTVNKDQGF